MGPGAGGGGPPPAPPPPIGRTGRLWAVFGCQAPDAELCAHHSHFNEEDLHFHVVLWTVFWTVSDAWARKRDRERKRKEEREKKGRERGWRGRGMETEGE